MSNLVAPSPEVLAERRRALRKQRRLRNLRRIWRGAAVAAMAGGAFWVLQHPFWLIQSDAQLQINGNTMLSDEAIKAKVPINYPQSLLDIEPEKLARALDTESPIEFARVDRHLFPPQVEITLQERRPVAITIPAHPGNSISEGDRTPTNFPGLIDQEGYWLAKPNAQALQPSFQAPSLRVRGYHRRYQSQWPSLYGTVQTSPVPIEEIDWRSPNNLILKTALGSVHLGVYAPQRLPQQLQTLAQLQNLKTLPNSSQIEYIDLSNPEKPVLKVVPGTQMATPPPTPSSETP